MSKLKILMITSTYPPSAYGGVGSIAHELSRELANRGNDVAVVTSKYGSGECLEITDRLKVYYVSSPPAPPKDVCFYFVNFKKITDILNEIKPDVVHDISSAFGMLPWISKTGPFVATIHGSPQISQIRAYMGSMEDHLRDLAFRLTHTVPSRLMTSLLKPNVDAYVFVSGFCLEDTLHNVDSSRKSELMLKSKIIYNGVDVDSLTRLKEKVADEDVEDESIVFLGRLMEYKGIFYLLSAFRDVVKELKRVKLHIIGTGPLFLRVKEYIDKNSLAENVTLHGRLPRVEALKLLAQSRFLVHPSFYESFCMSIVEAYALGRPVIAHRTGYAFEMVKEVGAGVLVDATLTEKFANSIINLMTDAVMYKKLSKSAETAVRERFNIRTTADKYESLFKELMINGSLRSSNF